MRRPLAILALLALPAVALAEARCSVIYGGEESVLRIAPAADPYRVPATAVGSYFLFRAVLETEPEELAALKTYVYADLDGGAVMVHQGEFDWPPASAGRYGFTGRQRAYEPLRDGELEYWCEAVS